MTTATSYREQAFVYWQQAQDELATGDLRQASEKGWGAAAQMVKAVADRRRLEHGGHRQLFEVVRSLKNPRLSAGFAFAHGLHTNFYEGWLSKEYVHEYLESVDVFITALADLP